MVGDRLQAKLVERAARELHDGETIRALVPVQTGPSPYWGGAFGGLGALLANNATERLVLVLTDQRLMKLDRQGQGVIFEIGRGDERFRNSRPDLSPGRLSWGYLRFSFGGPAEKYYFHRRRRAEARSLMAALLGSATS